MKRRGLHAHASQRCGGGRRLATERGRGGRARVVARRWAEMAGGVRTRERDYRHKRPQTHAYLLLFEIANVRFNFIHIGRLVLFGLRRWLGFGLQPRLRLQLRLRLSFVLATQH